jgi:hypothetical protein
MDTGGIGVHGGRVARAWDVPVPIHFEYGRFTKGFERFPRVAAKYPTVKFIGHAQTWWGNIDRLHRQEELYPAGPVASGGITDLGAASLFSCYRCSTSLRLASCLKFCTATLNAF